MVMANLDGGQGMAVEDARDIKEFRTEYFYCGSPERTPKYATVLVELDTCSECQRLMRVHTHALCRLSAGQVEAAGWGVESAARNAKGQPLCVDCSKAGKGSILCALCKQQRSSAEEQRSFGDPPEFLCTVCYDTTPARKWAEAVDKLEDEHQYDFC
jgi:hypothetical protein